MIDSNVTLALHLWVDYKSSAAGGLAQKELILIDDTFVLKKKKLVKVAFSN